MRVLVTFEDNYRIYRDVIASAIRNAHPHLEVLAVAGPKELDAEVARFDPHLVISSSQVVAPLTSQRQRGGLSWVALSVEPDQPSLTCVDGQYREFFNPSLEELLDVVEETELMLVGASQKAGERGAW